MSDIETSSFSMKINENFLDFMLALLVATASAALENESQGIAIEDAAFNMMNMPRMGYASSMMNQMMIPKPPQKAVDHYNSLTNNDFPVDYSMGCSNTCGCRQTCVVMWWLVKITLIS